MSKTLLAVNTLTSVSSQAYASHLNLVYRMGKESDDEFILFNGWRCSIDNFRNEAAKIALKGECDYLLFLDDDVLIPRDTYKILKSRNVDIITPVVFIRSYPFKPMFFKVVKISDSQSIGLTHYDDWENDVSPETPVLPVAAVGFSCCLIKVELLKKIRPAWFVTSASQTEDVYFCVKARQDLENRVGIYVDTSINAGHMLDPEFVSTQTRGALLRFYEELNPHLLNQNKGDHDKDYLDVNKAALELISETL